MRIRVLAVALLGLITFPCRAFEPFTVKDIRVEGIQRTEAGTVFSYLPIKVNDSVDEQKITAAIKALYGTGFFADVRIEAEADVLVVTVQERPAISQITISGAKEFKEEQLKDGLKQIELAEAKLFDKSTLDAPGQQIKRQYVTLCC